MYPEQLFAVAPDVSSPWYVCEAWLDVEARLPDHG